MAEPADEHLSARQWLDGFAHRLGVKPPTREEFSSLLELAGVAAHASQRVAAPVACWLAARADVGPADALRMARETEAHG